MNRLEILLKKWKAGSVKDPDLAMCLNYINNIQIEKLNERNLQSTERVDSVSGEVDSSKPKRSKAKGL